MERPFHRRKLSNVTGKNVYDDVFSGDHQRANLNGTVSVKVDEYKEIFGRGESVSTIPVLDLSNLDESSDCLSSKKPDYATIFGGFRDLDIAVTYQELIARDKIRDPSSTSQSSQDLGDESHQSSDALKQFNLSYNKINQRSKNGLDGTTHVTQLHAVPGFTCFIDESASQPKKETVKQNSTVINNLQPSVNFSKRDFPEKHTSRSDVESRSKHHQDDQNIKAFQADLESHPPKVTSSPTVSQPKKETEKQKSAMTNNIQPSLNSSKQDFDFPDIQTSRNDGESRSEYSQDKSLFGDTNFKTFQSDLESNPPKVSSSPTVSQPKNETEKPKSAVTNNIQPSLNSSKQDFDFPEIQTSLNDVESGSGYIQDKSLSGDANFKTFHSDLESNPPKVSSSPSVSQPKKETEKQKSAMTNNIQPSLNSRKQGFDFPKIQTSRNDVESGSGYVQDNSLSGDTNFKTFQSDPRHPSKVSSSTAASTINDEAAFPPKKETEKQNSLYDDIKLKTFQTDPKSHPSKVSLSAAASATNLNNNEEYQKRSPATYTEALKSDAPGGFPPPFFDEEVDGNSAAAVSAAALRKAIEKAQESIRIAKESVGRKKEGLRGFSSKSFKESLKVKRKVVNASTSEEQKEKDDKMKASHVFSNGRSHYKQGGTVNFPDFGIGEKLFGAKKVINEIHEKIFESTKNSEIPVSSSFEVRDNKVDSNSSEVVGETEAVDLGTSGKYEYATRSSASIENSTKEAPHGDNQKPHGFLIFKCFEEKVEDTEEKINNENEDEVRPSDAFQLDEGLNNLSVYEKVEDEKKIPDVSDQDGYEKRFSEVLGLLENKKQEVHEQEHDKEVVEDEIELKEEGNTKIHREDTSEKFYDVCEAEIIENVQTYSLGTNEVSSKQDCEMTEKENHEPEETWKNLDTVREPEVSENSSSDYDDAEGSGSVHSTSHIVIDTQETDDVSSSSEFQEEDDQDIEENEIFKNIYVDQTISEDEDECEAESDDLSNRGLADMVFGQNDARSESSSDTLHGMEIEVKEYNEREEAIVSEDEEEINLQSSHEETETPEIGTKMETKTETGTSQEPKDEVVEKEQTKMIKEVTAEERERERIKLAVERAIREARERAFIDARERAERAAVERATAEVRQRVMADSQERVAKASDKTSAQSKLRAERAAVERATTEARQRALEKAMSQKKTSEPKIQINEIKQASSSVTHTSVESALRSKAKMEKHNRIMERAAKALAEKEKRDMLVLKEQAERNRLSENLDADIKRWSSGKEGNLRALLSTLQYILGAESGWQALSLTEIITATAVKKAYRKATLCVHPDKLQQRGASIQQKYICEKVFDLLKAAWNKFNSEER